MILEHNPGIPNIGGLAKALAMAQLEFPKIEKNRTANAGSYSYQYCDLTDVIEAIKPIMAKNGLSFVQPYQIVNGVQVLETHLVHITGERITSQMLMPDPSKMKPQEFGAVSTYFKRYALTAMLGIASDEDTDGPKKAVGAQKQAVAASSPQKPGVAPKAPFQGREPMMGKEDVKVTEKQLARLFAIATKAGLNDQGVKDLAVSLGHAGSRKDMSRAFYDKLISAIEKLP